MAFDERAISILDLDRTVQSGARGALALVLAGALLGLAGCVAEDPAISTGGFDDDDTQPGDVDASPDEPDAEPGAPDAHPGSPDAHPTPDAHAAIPETLDVQFKTTSNGGQFSPKNIVAVWVEDSGGAFKKTIGRWAGTRRGHLVAWVQKSGQDADAVSGATRSNHTNMLSVHWDFKDRNGQVVPDGTYVIRMELADSNAFLTQQNHQGSFTIQKNGTAATQSTSGGGFESVSIDYSGR